MKWYISLLLVLVAVVAISGCIGSEASKVQVKVDYPGYWEGSYADDSGSQSISGTGSKTYDLPGDTTFVSVTAQKMDESSDKLTVQILKDGQVVAEKSTTAPYGIADVSATL
ncbi:MAG: hypothetical protein H5T36_00310 [Methanobacteriaceae archaeon]|nr:hypothetical protein [Methanobacteriaceae archaeon]